VILVQGVNPAATVAAAQNFASLQLLDNYTVGPWMRQRKAKGIPQPGPKKIRGSLSLGEEERC
jgi:hypothetical protein